MDFEFSGEQVMFRDMVRSFAEKEVRPIAAEFDQHEAFPVALVKKMADVGLLGLMYPEDYGGSDAGLFMLCIAMEELSRVDQSISVICGNQNSIGLYPLFHFGSEELKRHWIPPVIRGEHMGCFALTEPGCGSDVAGMQTRARRDGDSWVINGTKAFCTNSGTPITRFISLGCVTDVRDGRKEYSVILVPSDSPGLHIGPSYRKLGWRASDTHEITLEDCRVPADCLIGERGSGLKQMLGALDDGRIVVASMGVGLIQGCLDVSLQYAKERVAFGQPIASFQLIQAKIADMAVEVEAARWLTYRAARLAEQGRKVTKEAAIAKLFASEAAMRAAREAVQIHGGYGFTEEFPVSRFFRDAKLLEIGEGTSEIQRLLIARLLGC